MNAAPSGPPPELPGFEILETLGEGAMGSVWKARRLDDGRLVALKLLRPDGGDEGNDAALRLQDEARLLEGLRHPNLVAFLGAGAGPDGPWMAMELVEGGTLEERIRRDAPMDAETCAALVLPLLDAVALIHEAGIIHRDVKAANVFVDGQGCPRLGDFGLARSRETRLARTATGLILGTPDTMAPEQAMAGRPCPSWDLYALGCIAFRCLTGVQPFPGTNAVEVLRRKQSEDPPPLRRFRPDLPAPLETVLARSMARRPEGRYRNAETMRHDLDEAFAGRESISSGALTRQLSSASVHRTLLAGRHPRSTRAVPVDAPPSPSWRSRSIALAAAALSLLVLLRLGLAPSTPLLPPHLEWRTAGPMIRWSDAEDLGGKIELVRDDAPPRSFEGELLDGTLLFPLPEGYREGRVKARFFDGKGAPTLWRRLPLPAAPPVLVPRFDGSGRPLGATVLLEDAARIEIRDERQQLVGRSEGATRRLAFPLPPGRTPAVLRVDCLRPDRLPLRILLPLRDGESERQALVRDLSRIDAGRFLENRARRDGGFSKADRNAIIRSLLDGDHVTERLDGLGAHLDAFLRKAPLDERLATCQALLDLEVLGGLSLAFGDRPGFDPWPRVSPVVAPRPAEAPLPGPLLHRARFDYHLLSGREPWFTDQGRVLVGDAYMQGLARQHARIGETAQRSERGSTDEAAMRFMLFLDETGRNILKDPEPYRKARLELALPSLAGAKDAVLTLGVVKMQTRNCIRVRINDRLAVPFRSGWTEDHRTHGISALYRLSRRIPPEILREGPNRLDFVMDDLPGVEGILLALRSKLAEVRLDVTR